MRMGSLTVLTCTAIAVLAPATASASPPSPFGGVTVQRSDLHPGSVVRSDGLGAVVPPAGHSVTAVAETTDGSRTLVVKTDSKGRVFVTPEPQSNIGAAGSGPAPCSDNGYVLLGYKWYTEFDWYFHASATPSEITQLNARHDLEHGTENMKWENNDCGLPDNADVHSAYLGDTSLSTNISADPNCAANGDGVSVTGFRNINGSNILAVACTWSSAHAGYDQATESDVTFDKDTFTWYTGATPSGCSNKYSLEDVATHERGHTFGLGHPSESAHGNLTMSPIINGDCQRSETTLGLGDVLGMNALY